MMIASLLLPTTPPPHPWGGGTVVGVVGWLDGGLVGGGVGRAPAPSRLLQGDPRLRKKWQSLLLLIVVQKKRVSRADEPRRVRSA